MINVKKLDSEIIALSDLMDKGGKFKTDTSADKFPMMGGTQFQILKNSIDAEGQREPIFIWRNRIVDGRNRCKALNELGVTEVEVKKLPHKSTEEERDSLVELIENTRRHETPTQLACSAVATYYQLKNKGEKVPAENILKKFPVSSTNFKTAKWIYDNYHSDFTTLFDGGGIKLDGIDKVTSSLTAVKRLRMEQEAMNDFLSKESDKDVDESEAEEYVAMVTFVKMIAPLIKSHRKTQGLDTLRFIEALTDELMPDYSHKVIVVAK